MSKSIRRNTNRTANPELATALQQRIINLLDRQHGSWTGTMTSLNAAITTGLRFRNIPAYWPKSPSMLRRAVNRVVPSLRKSGIRVQFGRTTDHMRTRYVSFRQN
jgi:hypothetical protein